MDGIDNLEAASNDSEPDAQPVDDVSTDQGEPVEAAHPEDDDPAALAGDEATDE